MAEPNVTPQITPHGTASGGPVYRVCTPRILLRAWEVDDAPALGRAIEESLEHLRAWMDWAMHEPSALPDVEARIATYNDDVRHGRDWTFGLFDPERGEVLGGMGMHPRIGPGGLEIGYWMHVRHTGRGLATEAASALTRVGFELLGAERIEIRCDPENVRSAAIPRKLGYRHHTTLERNALTPDGRPRDTMVWALGREEYAGSGAASVATEAYDPEGARLM